MVLDHRQDIDILKDADLNMQHFLALRLVWRILSFRPQRLRHFDKANNEILSIYNQHRSGHITQDERYNKVVEVWSKTNAELTNEVIKSLQADKDGFNNIFMMSISGARGNRTQISQLAGMRGLMAKPNGEIIELPIRSNFKEGLTVMEFFLRLMAQERV